MNELELRRSSEDRRRFDLPGYGSVLRHGLFDPTVDLQLLDGTVLRTSKSGFFRMTLQAFDSSGATIGEFRSRSFSSGGELVWRGQSYELRSHGFWGTRYVVEAVDRPVAELKCSGWGGSAPARITITDPSTDPGLVLFLTWVVQRVVANNSDGGGGAVAGAV